MNKRIFSKNTSIVIVSILFSFLLLEILVRVVEHYQYTKTSNSSQFQIYKEIYQDRRDKSYVFEHKKNIKVRLEKGYYDFTISTNSEGLREKNDYGNIEKSVIFLGDSIIEGASVEDNEVIDEVFEKHTGITSLNFGIGSSNTVHEYHYIKEKYKKSYNAKLIVLGFCLNDFPQNISMRYFDENLGNWLLYKYNDQGKSRESNTTLWQNIKSLAKKSRLLTFVNNSLNDISGKRSLQDLYRYNDVDEEQEFYTELYINKISKFSKEIGSEFVVIIFPQRSQLDYEYGSNERMQDLLIEILKRNNIKYVDLFEIMKSSYKDHPEVRWFHDNTHPYVKGHQLYGEYLAQELPFIFPGAFK